MASRAKRVAIVQSNYIPWKGYFDLIRACDEFILYDDAQYTERDWRNRNRIKTANGLLWLTVPVDGGGHGKQAVKDVRIAGSDWAREHWNALTRAYGKAPHFKRYQDVFEPFYLGGTPGTLSEVNRRLIEAVCGLLGIATRIRSSMDYGVDAGPGPTEKLLRLCEKADASEYLSGPSAKAYLKEPLFKERGIRLVFADYSGYPEYPQMHPPFVHEVSALDLLFNAGPDAVRYLKEVA
jgi:hypothetical protein